MAPVGSVTTCSVTSLEDPGVGSALGAGLVGAVTVGGAAATLVATGGGSRGGGSGASAACVGSSLGDPPPAVPRITKYPTAPSITTVATAIAAFGVPFSTGAAVTAGRTSPGG